MDVAVEALDRMFLYLLIAFAVLGGVFTLSVVDATKSKKAPVFMFALGACLLISVFAFLIPFLKDYGGKQIVVQEGVYVNAIGDISKSSSGILGMHSVSLTADGEEIALTTIPHSDNAFPQGEYLVRAYYTENSKWLLHIEILQPSDVGNASSVVGE